MAPAIAAGPEGLFALGEMAALSGSLKEAVDLLRGAAAFAPAAGREVVEALRSFCGREPGGEAAVTLAEVLLDNGDFAGRPRSSRRRATSPRRPPP